MRVSIIRTAALAVASTILPTVLAAAPTVDGVQGIADSLNVSTQNLTVQANYMATANAALGGNVFTNVGPTFDITRALSNIVSTFWQTAFDVEKKVCVISSTINPQTVATAQANLVAGVQAQVNTILRIATTVQATIASLKTLAAAFSTSEMAALSDLIKALAIAASAAAEPVSALAAGGAALGLTGLAQSAADLQGSVAALVNTTASLNIVT